jgi:3-dehydroquinate synthase
LLQHIKAKHISVFAIKDGERYKNMETILNILNHCFAQKLNRNSMLIAFGGGVVGDMTGFTASIYQRGIKFVQVPTTLLSQVDASVGGKTGINNSYGKNLIGTFHQPTAVYIDKYFLSTLPSREFGAGVAEIVKMAVCFDKEFFVWLLHNKLTPQNINKAIELSVKTKTDVVSQDEKEQGIRVALNYGHTFGHIVENETNYKQYLHGEAVSIGMVMANTLSVSRGLMTQDEATQIKTLLQSYGLPTFYKIKDIDKFYDKFFLDKKSTNNHIKFILPNSIGKYIVVLDLEKNDIIKTLECFV